MSRPRRLHVRLHRYEALRVTGASIEADHHVYVFLTDSKIPYEKGYSRIAYIGTTKRGARRMAASAAYRADTILSRPGVWAFDARVITCRPRRNVKTWRKLERALLLAFKARYGEQPICNVHGKRMRERDEFAYFQRRRIDRIVDELS